MLYRKVGCKLLICAPVPGASRRLLHHSVDTYSGGMCTCLFRPAITQDRHSSHLGRAGRVFFGLTFGNITKRSPLAISLYAFCVQDAQNTSLAPIVGHPPSRPRCQRGLQTLSLLVCLTIGAGVVSLMVPPFHHGSTMNGGGEAGGGEEDPGLGIEPRDLGPGDAEAYCINGQPEGGC